MFVFTTKTTQPRPQVFPVNIGWLIAKFFQILLKVNYACAFSQSETEKYFEWIVIEINVKEDV